MKILYAVQKSGNGHMTRAQEILPILEKYADVDLMVSGNDAQLSFGKQVKYAYKGVSFQYDKQGGIDYLGMVTKNNFISAISSIKKVPVKDYDVVVNDFEPISAWACKFKKHPLVSICHQAALVSEKCPKPKNKNLFGEWVIKNFAPMKDRIGFHYKAYDDSIYTPIIKKSLREIELSKQGHYVVYLPSFSLEVLTEVLSKVDVEWRVFSKSVEQKNKVGNIEFNPVSKEYYLESFSSSEGILCNAGFQSTSEALYLNKKIYAIPIKGQYEQELNVWALKDFNVFSSTDLSIEKLKEWTSADNQLTVDFADETEKIIYEKIIKKYQ